MTNCAYQINELDRREQQWFLQRMNIKTQAGMLRQYQMEEKERGYKIQTLEFKSPQYLLKNFISGNSPIRVVHAPDKKLRNMQGRNFVKASLENLFFLNKSVFLFCARSAERGFSLIMPAPKARLAGLYSAALTALLLLLGIATQLSTQIPVQAPQVASNHTQKRSISSLQQKKFHSQVKGLL